MQPEELILVSVDDHVAELPSMFDGHVPEKYRASAGLLRSTVPNRPASTRSGRGRMTFTSESGT